MKEKRKGRKNMVFKCSFWTIYFKRHK
jgi:hypothetical protein